MNEVKKMLFPVVRWVERRDLPGYFIPDMNTLRGKIGKEIYDEIVNSPAPDLTELRKQAELDTARIRAAVHRGDKTT